MAGGLARLGLYQGGSSTRTSGFRRPSGGISGQRVMPTLSGSAGVGASRGFFSGGGGAPLGGGVSKPGLIRSYPSPVAPTGTPGGAGSKLAKLIADRNAAAEKEAQARDKEQARLNKIAYESMFMSQPEYEALERKGFETTRAQYGQVGREFGESAYGQVNIGALRAGARDIKMGEAEAIGRGVTELGIERGRRRGAAGQWYAGAEQTRQSQFEIPRYEIPGTFGQEEMATAIGGPTAPTTAPIPTQPTFRKPQDPLFPGGLTPTPSRPGEIRLY